MSISSSIFQKPCPACASSVSVSLARCHCGHLFESSANGLSPEEAALRDEELYEGYLAARADQSEQAARAADLALFDDPDNPELISAASLAREVAKSIELDLAEQRSKIAAMRSTLVVHEPMAQVPDLAPATKEVPAFADARKTASARPSKAVSEPKLPVHTVTSTAIKAEPVSKPAAASTPVKNTAAPVWQATTAQKAAGVLAALKNAKAREAVARSQQAIAVAAQAEQAAAPRVSSPVPASSAVPPSDFRKEQASRAEKIMEAQKSADAKECPNCTSSVPTNTTRCRCGFAFITGGTELPSLTLCTGDFTALRNSLKLNLRS